MLGPNWKTTMLGASAILGAIAHTLNGVATGDLSTLGTDLLIMIAGLQGLVAKDNNVTGGTVSNLSGNTISNTVKQ